MREILNYVRETTSRNPRDLQKASPNSPSQPQDKNIYFKSQVTNIHLLHLKTHLLQQLLRALESLLNVTETENEKHLMFSAAVYTVQLSASNG